MDEAFRKAALKIIITGHKLTDEVSKALKDYDSSEPQYNVLRILRGAKGSPLTVQEITSKMIQKSSNVTRIIDKLLSKEYVIRKQCPTNRRKMDIVITKKGLDFIDILTEQIKKIHGKRKQNITKEESEQLVQLIDKMFSNENNK